MNISSPQHDLWVLVICELDCHLYYEKVQMTDYKKKKQCSGP